LKLDSSITFLYFDDLSATRRFFESVLCLEQVLDQTWAVIWRTGRCSFLGAVDSQKGSISATVRGGVLVTLVVEDIEHWHREIKTFENVETAQVSRVTPIKENSELELKSFFFKGPEGYDFEIQEFTEPEIRKLFCSTARD